MKYELVISRNRPSMTANFDVTLITYNEGGHGSSTTKSTNTSYNEAIRLARELVKQYHCPIRANFVAGDSHTAYEDYLEECDADWGIEDGKAQPDVEPLSYNDFFRTIYTGRK